MNDKHTAADPVAEIRDLRVVVEGRAIVDGVSLRVRPGRVTALIGASGSGKTTTGLALLGEYPEGARVTGEVRVADGGAVGYVPQHPAVALNPARRVSALLTDIARTRVRRLPLRRRRAAARDRVLGVLKEAQLPRAGLLLRRRPHQLSGGQQQRVVLAQALLSGARLIVADEPTTGLDALTKSRVVERFRAVAARGIAVLLLSHDLDVVHSLADEVVVLRAGRVVESGPAERLLTAPRDPWTRELLHGRTRSADSEHLASGYTPPRAREAPPGVPTGGSEPPPVLRVRGLTARHRDGARSAAVVVRVPELTLYPGRSLAVAGRSGSGKTTLARCVAGLHRDHDGEILLGDDPLPHSLRDRDRAQLAAVQYVFQDSRAAFDEHRPVVQQVARTAVRLLGTDQDAAMREALTTLSGLGLPEEAALRRPGRLSGGELQRAALARALLARPRVLICDEITSGLDPLTRRGMLDMLTGLVGDRGALSLVLITHDLSTAALTDRVAVLDGGELVEEGPTPEVLAAPAHPFTIALTGAAARPVTGTTR